VPVSSWPAYDLTTVRQPANRMVAETISMILECIENKKTKPRQIKIDGPLIMRGSTRISTKLSK
jgi:DNA-binding LacI/PurR family transcriptional regulator